MQWTLSALPRLIQIAAVVECVLVAVLCALGAVWATQAARRAVAYWRTPRALRDAETGSCDGLNARQIAYLVDELWIVDRPSRRP